MTDKDKIEISDLPSNFKSTKIYTSYPLQSLEEMETKYIKFVLNYTKGNKNKASSILKIDRKTLRLKIKKYGLE